MAGNNRDRGTGIYFAAGAGSLLAALAMTATAFAAAPAAKPAAPTLAPPAATAKPPVATPATPVTPPPVAAPQAAAAGAPGAAQQWIKLCSPDPTTKKNLCLVQQEIYADTGQFIASATIRAIQDDPKMQFIIGVPPGMLIQPGLKAQIDDGKPVDLKYSICFPNTCFADLDITADFVKTVKGGKQITISAMNQGAQAISFPLTLAGFSKVYDGAGVDPNTPSGQAALDALSASLKAHADEARQRLIDQQQARPNQ